MEDEKGIRQNHLNEASVTLGASEDESLRRLLTLGDRLIHLEQLNARLSQLQAQRSNRTHRRTVAEIPQKDFHEMRTASSVTLPNAIQTDENSLHVREDSALNRSPQVIQPNFASASHEIVEAQYAASLDMQGGPLERTQPQNQRYNSGNADVSAKLSTKSRDGDEIDRTEEFFSFAHDAQSPPSPILHRNGNSKMYQLQTPSKTHASHTAFPEVFPRDINPTQSPPLHSPRASDLHAHPHSPPAQSIGFKVESRRAHTHAAHHSPPNHDGQASDQHSSEWTDGERREARALDEAKERTVPYLFGGFSRQSPVRIKCFQMHRSARWRATFTVINLANCLYIGSLPELNRNTFNGQGITGSGARRVGAAEGGGTVETLFELFCVAAIVFEVLVGCIAVGLVSSPTSYLRCSYFHRLDAFILLLTALEYYLVYVQDIMFFSFRAFRMLKLLQPLLSMRIFSESKQILKTLAQGATQIVTITAVLILFTLAFAVFGMSIYQKSFRRRCVTLDHYVSPCSIQSPVSDWGSTCNFTAAEVDFLPPSHTMSHRRSLRVNNHHLRHHQQRFAGRQHHETIWGFRSDIRTNVSLFSSNDEPIHSVQGVLVAGGDIIHSGGYPFEELCKIFKNKSTIQLEGVYPFDSNGGFYHNCEIRSFTNGNPVHATCASGYENPAHDFMHFDHIGGTLLSLAMYTLIDGAYEVLHSALESEPEASILTGFFFVAVTFTNTFVVLGLFLAVVANTFKEVRQKISSEKGVEPSKVRAASFPNQQEQLSLSRVHPEPSAADTALRATMETTRDHDLAGGTFQKAQLVLAARTGDADEDGAELLARWANAILQDPKAVHGSSAMIIVHVITMIITANRPASHFYAVEVGLFWGSNLFFTAEVLTRLTAAGGSKTFFLSSFNSLEASLVACGISALLGGPTMLGLLPAIRLFRLCQYFPTLQDLLMDAIQTIPAFLNLMMFVGIVSLCFSVAFRYMFRNDIVERNNFSSLGQALLTTFQIFTGDQWSVVLFDAMKSRPDTGQRLYAALVIFIWLLFSRIIFSDLCVAVLIENFEIAETVRLIAKPGRLASFRDKLRMSYQRIQRALASPVDGTSPALVGPTFRINTGLSTKTHSTIPSSSLAPVPGKPLSHKTSNLDGGDKAIEVLATSTNLRLLLEAVNSVPSMHKRNSSPEAWASSDLVGDMSRATVNFYPLIIEEEDEDTLLFFGPKNPVRVFSTWLTASFGFQTLIYTSIFLSCILLMQTPPSDDPVVPSGPFPLWFRHICDRVLTGIFAFEFMVMIISKGFIATRHAYLRSAWNVMDFFILVLSLLDLLGIRGSLAKIGRLGRALRPLRLVKRNKGLREMMEALFATLPPLAYVTALFLMLGLVFSIVGMGLFAGRFHRCSYDVVYPQGKAECSGVYADTSRGFLMPRAWWLPPYNFDTLPDATLTLFRVTTVKYVDVLRIGMDVTDRDVSPRCPPDINYRIFPMQFGDEEFVASQDYSFANCIFFVIYLILAFYFVMNVFIAFIVDGFNLNRGSTPADIYYNKFLRLVELRAPREIWFRPPRSKLSQSLRRVAETGRYKMFSLGCVAINVIFMLSDHADATEAFTNLMTMQSTVFFLVLVFEVVVNLIGYGPGGFIDDSWKLFDLAIMLGSASSYLTNDDTVGRAAKAFRLLRVIRLMRMIKAVRAILETMIASLPQFGNIFLLLFLMYSIFATLFVQEIGLTKYGLRLGPTAKFEDFITSMTTIYQMVIQDEWMMIMDDASIQPPFCTARFEGHEFGDCGVSYARFLFVPFKLICESILLNLFIGVILEKFAFITDEISAKEDLAWSAGPSGEQFQGLVHVFERFAAGSNSVSIQAAISSLLTTQLVPLGFRTHEGGLELEAPEIAARRMIRAELNVILRHHHQEANRRREQYRLIHPFLRLVSGLIPGPRVHFVNGVEFSAVARALLRWRKPSLLPDSVKAENRELVEEAADMACAITIYEFLRSIVARRRQAETASFLRKPLMLRRWMNADRHYLRRAVHYSTVRDQHYGDQAGWRRRIIEFAPERSALYHLIPFHESTFQGDEHRNIIVLHADAVAQRKVKMVKPRTGMEEFQRLSSERPTVVAGGPAPFGRHRSTVFAGAAREGLENTLDEEELRGSAAAAIRGAGGSAVILRFIDSVNQERGSWAVDLSTWNWNGWQMESTEDDIFLRPMRASFTRDPARWTSLEFSLPMTPNAGTAPRAVSSSNDEQIEEIWCVLDVQSYMDTENSGDAHGNALVEAPPAAAGTSNNPVGDTQHSENDLRKKPRQGASPAPVTARRGNRVRLHLALKSAMKGATEQREMQTAAVVEVVSYLGAAAAAVGPSGVVGSILSSPDQSRSTVRSQAATRLPIPTSSSESPDGRSTTAERGPPPATPPPSENGIEAEGLLAERSSAQQP